MLEHPELRMTDEGYDAPEPGCPIPLSDSGRPLLPMPWRNSIETFVPPGVAIPAFDVDYEVAPLASVESLTATFEFDARVEPADGESAGHCPATIPPTFWAPESIEDDVIRVRVAALDAEGHGRRADVFASRGSRTLHVSIAGIDRTSTDADDHWFVAFEPAVGVARLALAEVSADANGSIDLSGLPTGAGRVLLLQTASVVKQPDSEILHAPSGFAGDVSAYSRGWYQALVWPDDGESVTLAPIVPTNVTARYAQLGELGVRWETEDPPLVVGLSGRSTTGTLQVACGSGARLTVTGFATVSLSVDGAAATTLEPGQTVTPSAACANGATHATWTLQTTSLNGRASDLVIGGAL